MKTITLYRCDIDTDPEPIQSFDKILADLEIPRKKRKEIYDIDIDVDGYWLNGKYTKV